MRFSFVQFRAFSSKWKGSGLRDEDLQAMEMELMARPEGGPVMRGTSGLRKMRFAPPSWHGGKSGALRVCYAVFRQYALIYLVTFFAKNESGNLSAVERNEIKRLLQRLADGLSKGQNP